MNATAITAINGQVYSRLNVSSSLSSANGEVYASYFRSKHCTMLVYDNWPVTIWLTDYGKFPPRTLTHHILPALSFRGMRLTRLKSKVQLIKAQFWRVIMLPYSFCNCTDNLKQLLWHLEQYRYMAINVSLVQISI